MKYQAILKTVQCYKLHLYLDHNKHFFPFACFFSWKKPGFSLFQIGSSLHVLAACVRIDLLHAYLFWIFKIYVILLVRFSQQAVSKSDQACSHLVGRIGVGWVSTALSLQPALVRDEEVAPVPYHLQVMQSGIRWAANMLVWDIIFFQRWISYG